MQELTLTPYEEGVLAKCAEVGITVEDLSKAAESDWSHLVEGGAALGAGTGGLIGAGTGGLIGRHGGGKGALIGSLLGLLGGGIGGGVSGAASGLGDAAIGHVVSGGSDTISNTQRGALGGGTAGLAGGLLGSAALPIPGRYKALTGLAGAGIGALGGSLRGLVGDQLNKQGNAPMNTETKPHQRSMQKEAWAPLRALAPKLLSLGRGAKGMAGQAGTATRNSWSNLKAKHPFFAEAALQTAVAGGGLTAYDLLKDQDGDTPSESPTLPHNRHAPITLPPSVQRGPGIETPQWYKDRLNKQSSINKQSFDWNEPPTNAILNTLSPDEISAYNDANAERIRKGETPINMEQLATILNNRHDRQKMLEEAGAGALVGGGLGAVGGAYDSLRPRKPLVATNVPKSSLLKNVARTGSLGGAAGAAALGGLEYIRQQLNKQGNDMSTNAKYATVSPQQVLDALTSFFRQNKSIDGSEILNLQKQVSDTASKARTLPDGPQYDTAFKALAGERRVLDDKLDNLVANLEVPAESEAAYLNALRGNNKQGNDMSNTEEVHIPKEYVEGFQAKCAEFQLDPAKVVDYIAQLPEGGVKQAEAQQPDAYLEGFTATLKHAGATDAEIEEVVKQARLGGTMRRAINEAAGKGETIGEMKEIPVAGASAPEKKGISMKKLLAALGLGTAAVGAGAAVGAARGAGHEMAKEKVNELTD